MAESLVSKVSKSDEWSWPLLLGMRAVRCDDLFIKNFLQNLSSNKGLPKKNQRMGPENPFRTLVRIVT